MGQTCPCHTQDVTPGLWDKGEDGGHIAEGKGSGAKEQVGTPALLSLATHCSLSLLS